MTKSDSPQFKPAQNRVLFERIYPQQDPGAIVTGRVPDIPLECRVLAVGDKCEHVSPGMTVLIARSEGQTMQGVKGALCREPAILAIVS